MPTDDLPRTYHVSRLKSLAMLVVGVMFVGIGVLMVLDDNSFGWAGIILFGLLVPSSIWQLISPGSLRIEQSAIEVRHLWWTRRYELAECGQFAPGMTRIRERIVFDHGESTRPDWRQWLDHRIGIENCIPDTYGVGGEALCKRLNDLRIQARHTAR